MSYNFHLKINLSVQHQILRRWIKETPTGRHTYIAVYMPYVKGMKYATYRVIDEVIQANGTSKVTEANFFKTVEEAYANLEERGKAKPRPSTAMARALEPLFQPAAPGVKHVSATTGKRKDATLFAKRQGSKVVRDLTHDTIVGGRA